MKNLNFKNKEINKYIFLSVVLFIIWYIVFVWQPLSFWLLMSGGILVLISISLILKGKSVLPGSLNFSDFFWGLLSALVLYFIFWIFFKIGNLIFPDISESVKEVYKLADGYNFWFLTGLMLFIIGPGEEIFWRGFLQKHLEKNFSSFKAFIMVAAGYILVHIITGKWILVGASALAGIFWGALYLWKHRLWIVIISHAFWEIIIFLIIPIK